MPPTPEEKEWKVYKTVTLLAIAGIILAVVIIGVVKSEGTQCVNDPFQYGANVINDKSGLDISCTCFMGNQIMTFSNNEAGGK